MAYCQCFTDELIFDYTYVCAITNSHRPKSNTVIFKWIAKVGEISEMKMERWKDGKVERWKDGKMERWKDGKARQSTIFKVYWKGGHVKV